MLSRSGPSKRSQAAVPMRGGDCGPAGAGCRGTARRAGGRRIVPTENGKSCDSQKMGMRIVVPAWGFVAPSRLSMLTVHPHFGLALQQLTTLGTVFPSATKRS